MPIFPDSRQKSVTIETSLERPRKEGSTHYEIIGLQETVKKETSVHLTTLRYVFYYPNSRYAAG